MCGLVGMLSKRKLGLNHEEINAFKDLLTIDVLRGKDSTGVFSVAKRELQLFKVATHPMNAYDTKEWKEFESDARRNSKVLVGHNRAATRGTVNSNNAHPFLENNICLVHNGTLFNHTNLNKDSEVDSHAIAVALSKNNNVDEVINSIYGAFALIWFNSDTNEVIFTRNKDRPLFYAENNDMVAIGSEYLPLFYSLGRNKIDPKDIIQEVPVDEIFTFSGKTLKRRKLATPDPKGHSILSGGKHKSETSSTKTKVIFHMEELKNYAGVEGVLALGKIILPETFKGEDCRITLEGWEKEFADDLLNQPFYEAEIDHVSYHNRGSMYWLSYSSLNMYVGEECDTLDEPIPTAIRDHVIERHLCDECAMPFSKYNFHGAQVILDPADCTITTTCSDCVRAEMFKTDPELGDKFDEYFNSPVQERKQKRANFMHTFEKISNMRARSTGSSHQSKETPASS